MYTLKQFGEWCATQPRDKWVYYVESENCPIAQFLKAQGHTGVIVGVVSATLDGKRYALNADANQAAHDHETFGEIADYLTYAPEDPLLTEWVEPEYDIAQA